MESPVVFKNNTCVESTNVSVRPEVLILLYTSLHAFVNNLLKIRIQRSGPRRNVRIDPGQTRFRLQIPVDKRFCSRRISSTTYWCGFFFFSYWSDLLLVFRLDIYLYIQNILTRKQYIREYRGARSNTRMSPSRFRSRLTVVGWFSTVLWRCAAKRQTPRGRRRNNMHVIFKIFAQDGLPVGTLLAL